MTENQRKEQGERLKQIRKDLGMTQGDFADLIGTDQTQLSRTEKGSYAVQASYLSKLVQLGYNLNWLMIGMGSMKLGEIDNKSQVATAEESGIVDTQQKILEFLKSKFPDFDI